MAGDDGQVATHEVPNPDYVELQVLLAQARRAATAHGHGLDRAGSLMGEARVWTGPAAAAGFATDVEGRRGALPGCFAAFIAEIEHRMRHTPTTVERHTRVW